MSETASLVILSAVCVFARVGSCIMVLPGLSSPRFPMRARLYIAIGLSLAFTPLLYEKISLQLQGFFLSAIVRLVLFETFIGISIGLVSRFFFLMFEMMISAIAMAIGLAGIAGMPLDENAGEPTLVTFILLSATLLFFLADLHLEVLRQLYGSYQILPPGPDFPARLGLSEIVDTLASASLLALRLSGPFLILSIVINFAFGLANKMTPMIQIYFAAMPVLIGLGFLLMMLLAKPILLGFVAGFDQFLAR